MVWEQEIIVFILIKKIKIVLKYGKMHPIYVIVNQVTDLND